MAYVLSLKTKDYFPKSMKYSLDFDIREQEYTPEYHNESFFSPTSLNSVSESWLLGAFFSVILFQLRRGVESKNTNSNFRTSRILELFHSFEVLWSDVRRNIKNGYEPQDMYLLIFMSAIIYFMQIKDSKESLPTFAIHVKHVWYRPCLNFYFWKVDFRSFR